MNRNIEIISITNPDDNKNYIIGNSHLESEFNKKQPNHFKISQFIEVFKKLENFEKESQLENDLIIFMGDTNISNDEESLYTEKIPNGWVDYFIEFGSPKQLEYTYDHTKNNNTYFPVKSRLDRIYYKKLNGNLEPYTFSFLGQEPIKNIFLVVLFSSINSIEKFIDMIKQLQLQKNFENFYLFFF
jgi:hypothetical protein